MSSSPSVINLQRFFFHAVKGGVSLPQPLISAIFKVLLSLFLLAQFFIGRLTLPHIINMINSHSLQNHITQPLNNDDGIFEMIYDNPKHKIYVNKQADNVYTGKLYFGNINSFKNRPTIK